MTTKFELFFPVATNLKVLIYDILGREIDKIIKPEPFIGHGEFVWEGVDYLGKAVANGVYFIQFVGSDLNGETKFKNTRKIVFLK